MKEPVTAEEQLSPPRSLRKAIDAMCKWCIYDPKSGGGNWRQQVTACAITRCALWPVRPLSRGESPASEAETAPEEGNGD